LLNQIAEFSGIFHLVFGVGWFCLTVEKVV
jgi:hypothetical protein